MSARCSLSQQEKRWSRNTLAQRALLQRREQRLQHTEDYVSFPSHRGTLQPADEHPLPLLQLSGHSSLCLPHDLLKSLHYRLLRRLHPHPPSSPLSPPPAFCSPEARMEKTLCSPGTNRTNSSSSPRKPASRSGSHSPGSGSLGGSAGAGGGRGTVQGSGVSLQQQELHARRRQLEGVLSKYTNLIQGWQNR